MLENLNREYNEFTREVKALMTEAFDESELLPEDWSWNSDVAVVLIKLAAEIVVREEITFIPGNRDLFVEWCERAYDNARKHAAPEEVL